MSDDSTPGFQPDGSFILDCSNTPPTPEALEQLRQRIEAAVKIEVDGRWFTFRVQQGSALSFWIVECEGKVWRSPVSFTGQEKPGFFLSMVRSAEHHGLWQRSRRTVDLR